MSRMSEERFGVTGVRASKEGGWKEGRKNEVRPQRAGCAKFGF